MPEVSVSMPRRLPVKSPRQAEAILRHEGERAARKAAGIVRTSWSFTAPRSRRDRTGETPRKSTYAGSIKAAEPRQTATGVVVDVFSDHPAAGALERGVRRRKIKASARGKRGIPVGNGVFRGSFSTGRPAGRYAQRAKQITAPAVRQVYQDGAARAAARLRGGA